MWYTVYRWNFEVDEMMVIFGVFTLFSFLLCSRVLEEYTTTIIRGIEPVQVDLPWRWSQYVPLKCQNKSKHCMLQNSNRWPSFDQQWWKKLKTYTFQVKCPHTKHKKPKYSLQRLHCGQPYIYVLQVELQIHFINRACHAYLFQVQKYVCFHVYSQCVVFEIN